MNNIRADYVHILLMEANEPECSPLDIKGLEIVMRACIVGDEAAVRAFTTDSRPRVRSAASFIMRKHDFATARATSEAVQQTQRRESQHGLNQAHH